MIIFNIPELIANFVWVATGMLMVSISLFIFGLVIYAIKDLIKS